MLSLLFIFKGLKLLKHNFEISFIRAAKYILKMMLSNNFA